MKIWSMYESIYGEILNWQVKAIRRMSRDYHDKFVKPELQRLRNLGIDEDFILTVEMNGLTERDDTGETQAHATRRLVDAIVADSRLNKGTFI